MLRGRHTCVRSGRPTGHCAAPGRVTKIDDPDRRDLHMPSALPHGWLVVQRADAPDEDLARVDALVDTLGDTATVHRTADTEDLDAAIDALDGRGLVVGGGDGSVHLAANRLAHLGRLDEVVTAVFPAGTGNDLAHTLGLPDEPASMAELLRSGREHRLDLLDLGDHGVAANAAHAGIGVDAAARSQDLPEGLGTLAYPLGALLAGVGAEGFTGEVWVDDQLVEAVEGSDTLMVLVLNGRTIGGGHVFVEQARPDDGVLDVLVCQSVGVAARAAFGLAVTRGTHHTRDDVATARGTTVEVRGTGISWNVDGELWTDPPLDDLTIRLRPAAWRTVLPPR